MLRVARRRRRRARARRSCRGTSPRSSSEMCRTTERSCAMNRYARPSRSCRSSSRFTTPAWIDTSSAETGSSSTSTSARARSRGRCRCAGADRRRTRAGTGCRARGSARRAPAARAPARVAIAGHSVDDERLARRSTATVMRGSSDAYGSWNTICMLAAVPRAARRFETVMRSMPSNFTDPDVGSMSRSTQRPTVDFPNPTPPPGRASCPVPSVERHAGDRLHDDLAAADAAHREVLRRGRATSSTVAVATGCGRPSTPLTPLRWRTSSSAK